MKVCVRHVVHGPGLQGGEEVQRCTRGGVTGVWCAWDQGGMHVGRTSISERTKVCEGICCGVGQRSVGLGTAGAQLCILGGWVQRVERVVVKACGCT